MDKSQKILVACPTYDGMDYCLDRFIQSITSLDYESYDILIVDNSEKEEYYQKLSQIQKIKVIRDKTTERNPRKKIVGSRNKIIEYALQNNYDYIFMMDQDVIPPKEIIRELLKDDKDLVSGLYFNYFISSGKLKVLPVAWSCITPEEFEEMKKKITFPTIVKTNKDLRRHLSNEEINSNKTIEVLIPSAGCLLIKKSVFEKVEYSLLDLQKMGFSDKTIQTTDDIGFILDAEKKGFKSYCNTKVKCDHLISEKYQKDADGNFVHRGLKN